MTEDVQRHSVHTLVFRSLKRSHDMFVSNQPLLPEIDEKLEYKKKLLKAKDTYGHIYDRVKASQKHQREHQLNAPLGELNESGEKTNGHSEAPSSALVPVQSNRSNDTAPGSQLTPFNAGEQHSLMPKKAPSIPKPKWHAPWKLYRVISGHLGWVRCVAVEPGNEWFATGSADRVIKVWDLASGKLKLSLTGEC